MEQWLQTGLFIFALTFFLDLLDMSFGRVVWFMKTLRFWLYFLLHFGVSCLAGYLIHSKLPEWYLLGPAATFLGVAVISNTNIKIAGFPLIPIADMFLSVKAKVLEQAAQDKANEVIKAQLVQRLRRLPVKKLEQEVVAVLIAAKYKENQIQESLNTARKLAKGSDDYATIALVRILLKTNQGYVEQNITIWERSFQLEDEK